MNTREISTPTFDSPQHPEVYTGHQSGGVFVAVSPQIRPVPGCHHYRGAPLTPQLGHPTKIFSISNIQLILSTQSSYQTSNSCFRFSQRQDFIPSSVIYRLARFSCSSSLILALRLPSLQPTSSSPYQGCRAQSPSPLSRAAGPGSESVSSTSLQARK